MHVGARMHASAPEGRAGYLTLFPFYGRHSTNWCIGVPRRLVSGFSLLIYLFSEGTHVRIYDACHIKSHLDADPEVHGPFPSWGHSNSNLFQISFDRFRALLFTAFRSKRRKAAISSTGSRSPPLPGYFYDLTVASQIVGGRGGSGPCKGGSGTCVGDSGPCYPPKCLSLVTAPPTSSQWFHRAGYM